ncbi:unknown [Brachyspira sp. CAG:484]|nr:unknown [Brachyspira sp. CAG:484]
MKLFKQLSEKLSTKGKKVSNQGMIKPIDVNFDISKNEFLDNLTKHAVKLYEKKCDIKNFSKLVLSNPENTSHNELVEELFQKGVIDPLEDEKLEKLADNSRFLRDLGLLE